MIPDLPYFVAPHRGSVWSHAAYGPVTVDLAAGLIVFAIWMLGLRRPLVDLAPTAVTAGLPPPRRLTATGWGWAALSVVTGATTHVVWDTFTHRRRWGTEHLTGLGQQVGPLPAYQWLQFGSGVLGLLVLAVWAWRWLRRQPRRAVVRVAGTTVRHLSWAVLVAAMVVGLVVPGLTAAAGPGTWEVVAVRAATGCISATGVALLVICGLWRLSAGRRSRAAPGPGSDHGVVGERPADRTQG